MSKEVQVRTEATSPQHPAPKGTFEYSIVRDHSNHFVIIIIIKKDWQCKAGRGRLTPYQSEDHSPMLPTYRGKEEKVKIVEDKKGESN